MIHQASPPTSDAVPRLHAAAEAIADSPTPVLLAIPLPAYAQALPSSSAVSPEAVVEEPASHLLASHLWAHANPLL